MGSTSERARTPRPSDAWDIKHVLCLPYVDVYSTDAFFAGVTKRSARTFKTEVVTKTTEVVEVLREKYGVR